MAADNQAKHTFILPAQTSTLNCICEVIIWPVYLRRKKLKNYQRNLKSVSNITASSIGRQLSCSLSRSWSPPR